MSLCKFSQFFFIVVGKESFACITLVFFARFKSVTHLLQDMRSSFLHLHNRRQVSNIALELQEAIPQPNCVLILQLAGRQDSLEQNPCVVVLCGGLKGSVPTYLSSSIQA